MKDFFISYNKADLSFAMWIAHTLREIGYEALIQADDMPPGSNFILEMDKAIKVTRQTIAVLSPDYLTSVYTQPEWAAAFRNDPTGEHGLLIPVRVRECEPKGLLGSIVYVDLVGTNGESAKELLITGIDRSRTKSNLRVHFPIDEHIKKYRTHIAEQVATVRIFGDPEPRQLERVFIDLMIKRKYDHPTTNPDYLGLMDEELRRRRDLFSWENTEPAEPTRSVDEAREGKIKLTELLRGYTRAVIVGPPGSGKSTLLRYLVLKTVNTSNRLPVLVELKNISHTSFEKAGGKFEELLFEKAISAFSTLQPPEEGTLRSYFRDRLMQGGVSVFLDGLDEVSDTNLLRRLNRALQEFLSSIYGVGSMIISARPYAIQAKLEGIQILEIAPLGLRQIRKFLIHFFDEESKADLLLNHLRFNPQLRELSRTPYFLGVIAHMYRIKNDIIRDPLKLYQFIVRQLSTQLDREKSVDRFRIEDPEGKLKLEFLRRVAFDRLFVDHSSPDSNRLVFTGEYLFKKAQVCCPPGLRPDLLAADAVATPLIRAIASDTYAFLHLTIHEYLVATVLAEQEDFKHTVVSCCFDPLLCEMEILPMALGLVENSGEAFEMLENLPESLKLSNLRLRIRALTYARNVSRLQLSSLLDAVQNHLASNLPDEGGNLAAVLRSFSFIGDELRERISEWLINVDYRDYSVYAAAIEALGRIGGNHATSALVRAFRATRFIHHLDAADALLQIRTEQVIDAMIEIFLGDEEDQRYSAALMLHELGGDRAAAALITRIDDSDEYVRKEIAEALADIEWKEAEARLTMLLTSENVCTRENSALTLALMGSVEGVEALCRVAQDKTSALRLVAISYLGSLGGTRTIASLSENLRDENDEVRLNSTAALASIGTNLHDSRVELLFREGLSSSDSLVREASIHGLEYLDTDTSRQILWNVIKGESGNERVHIAYALAARGSKEAMDVLRDALRDRDRRARRTAINFFSNHKTDQRILEPLLENLAMENASTWTQVEIIRGLGHARDERALPALLAIVNDSSSSNRADAADSLGEIGDMRAVPDLLKLLDTRDDGPRLWAARALGAIRDQRALPKLIQVMGTGSEYFRRDVVAAIAAIGREKARLPLLKALKDEDPLVRDIAVRELGKIGGHQIVIPLLELTRDDYGYVRKTAMEVLTKLSPDEVLIGLTNGLRHSAEIVREKIVRHIGYYSRSAETVEQLLHLAERDRSENVRKVARTAASQLIYRFGHDAKASSTNSTST